MIRNEESLDSLQLLQVPTDALNLNIWLLTGPLSHGQHHVPLGGHQKRKHQGGTQHNAERVGPTGFQRTDG